MGQGLCCQEAAGLHTSKATPCCPRGALQHAPDSAPCTMQSQPSSPHGCVHRRMEYKPHLIRWEEVKPEAVSGKQMIYHCTDKKGRPLLLMRPR